ncbi:hypothetical protein Y1Q_0000115 [Alligator mississippiensis]|uniref:Uncharacterized protein n=1 Tax=Alligator mississippiensis TaxID=8496 RepID=A0A151NQT5_ALLMI|nr:hypothetical protein Y1Q_0000115 [Alligator mississippiensis]
MEDLPIYDLTSGWRSNCIREWRDCSHLKTKIALALLDPPKSLCTDGIGRCESSLEEQLKITCSSKSTKPQCECSESEKNHVVFIVISFYNVMDSEQCHLWGINPPGEAFCFLILLKQKQGVCKSKNNQENAWQELLATVLSPESRGTLASPYLHRPVYRQILMRHIHIHILHLMVEHLLPEPELSSQYGNEQSYPRTFQIQLVEYGGCSFEDSLLL